MQRILRLSICLAALVLAAFALTACGGDEADSSTDVNQLLKDTFSGDKKVESGKLSVQLKLTASGGDTGLDGPVDITLSGPFQSQGETELPKFDLDASLEGAGQSIRAGVTSTGEKGFVNFNGTEYAVAEDLFKQFREGFEEAAKKNEDEGKGQSLQSLGIDPTKWLTNAKNAGEAKVGDADTIKITGDVDVPKLLDDVNTALGKASSLGAAAAGAPQELTAEQREQIQKAVQDVDVEIYTGKEDTTLRRMFVDLDIKDPEGKQGTAKIVLDIAITELNEDQEIEEPENAKPFDQLLEQIAPLLGGSVGSTGSAGSSATPSAGSGGSGSSSAPSQEQLKKFTDCVEAAGSDQAKAQECADLIQP